jgi:hypothetical protein
MACVSLFPDDSTMPQRPAEEAPRKWWPVEARSRELNTRDALVASPHRPAGIERPEAGRKGGQYRRGGGMKERKWCPVEAG